MCKVIWIAFKSRERATLMNDIDVRIRPIRSICRYPLGFTKIINK